MVIALNVVLITAVILLLAGLLAWAIVSDRNSKRAAGGGIPQSDAPLHRNLVMPRRHMHLGRKQSGSPSA
jgi:hypothetical protein